jgi:enterochelin esterase family protein
MENTDLWYLTLELPKRSRIEYKFDIHVQGRREWIRDPFNPIIARDPFGANSVCSTSGYEAPHWIQPDPEARQGYVVEHVIHAKAFEGERHFQVYLPARFRRTRRYPIMVVHDGYDYLRYASLRTVLDNLIHRLEIAPMIVVFLHSGDRLREYGADERHAKFLVEDLLPFLEDHYPIGAGPRHRGLMGASFGAVAALHGAWRYQGIFGRLLLQSGSFAFTDIGKHQRGPAFDPVVPFVNEFRDQPGRPAEKLFVSCGTYESLIYENRSLVPLLQASGMMVKYEEARDGHNWENWRDRLRNGLSWLYPGPLWMVYE